LKSCELKINGISQVSTLNTASVRVSAIVTAFQRISQTVATLHRLQECRPTPDEILVHVDGKQNACAEAVRRAFPNVTVVMSDTSVGPGGGRNRLVAAARNELIASFDDDSYPADKDYFSRVEVLAETFPEAALFAASIFHQNEFIVLEEKLISRTASFGAGGVVFRRSEFMAAGGFVSLAIAYGMEEEDLALRLLNRGKTLLHCPFLRVFHDTDRSHHNSALITSGTIANVALLAWLRYPARYWPYGVLQVANRCIWCIRVGRRSGIISGLGRIPGHLWKYRHFRQPVSPLAMKYKLAMKSAQRKKFSEIPP
jgi:GT2 family glycosyltransferase